MSYDIIFGWLRIILLIFILLSPSPISVRLLSAEGVPAETRVAAVVQEVSAELLAGGRLEHLVEGQLEENLTFEAAWRRGGFAEDDMENES